MDKEEICDQFLIRNLRDADCDDRLIQEFLELYQRSDYLGQIRLLKSHRISLIEQMHHEQRKIDSLDYLLYTLKKCINKEEK